MGGTTPTVLESHGAAAGDVKQQHEAHHHSIATASDKTFRFLHMLSHVFAAIGLTFVWLLAPSPKKLYSFDSKLRTPGYQYEPAGFH